MLSLDPLRFKNKRKRRFYQQLALETQFKVPDIPKMFSEY